jgi:dolichyl-diphosphooligosaccharide--protein glycosyltransferase
MLYFLGKDVGGKKVALFSSLFLALNTSYVGRTSLGWFDDETVGIFSILLFFFFFLRSIEKDKPLKTSLGYSLASGLTLGYLCTSWGASRYPIGMTALFVFILILMRRYTSRLLYSYGISFGIAFFIAINVPKLGLGFLTETFNLPVPAVFLMLCLCELLSFTNNRKTKMGIIFSFFILSVISIVVFMKFGLINATPGKFIGVLNPFSRLTDPLVKSVGEHPPGAWGYFFYEYGIGIFFIPVGLYFTLQNPTNRNIFLSIFALTTAYFASSMIRLTLIMAPAFCLLWAVALVRLLEPFISIIKGVSTVSKRKLRFRPRVSKKFSSAFLIINFILLTYTFAIPRDNGEASRPINSAYIPTTLAMAALPIKPDVVVTDWMEVLVWMRDNLPPTAVVASWWDYGYWITTMSNKTTLVDNGTSNMTQIGTIGLMFLSNETEAKEILGKYDATHVVVFTSFDYTGRDLRFGDDGKWNPPMLDIAAHVFPDADLKAENFGKYETDPYSGQTYWSWNSVGENTTIYKLMTYGKQTRLNLLTSTQTIPLISLEHFKLVKISNGPLIYGTYLTPVCVYEVMN